MKIPTVSPKDKKVLERYLYSELTASEQDEIEGKLFDDDALFFEAMNVENDLVDQYVKNKLDSGETARFERSLATNSERMQMVANAAAIQEFVSEERVVAPPVVSPIERGFGSISNFFGMRTPALSFGMAGLLVALMLLSGVLIIDNRRKANELAGLKSEDDAIKELQKQLAESNTRESEMQGQIDGERETSGDLTDDLQRERQQREKILAELERIKKDRETTPETSAPVIATLLLTPLSGSKGGDEIKNVAPVSSVKRLALQLTFPDSAKAGERVSVSLNSRPIARNVAVRSSNGQKKVQVSIPTSNLKVGENQLSVQNAAGETVSEYAFNFQRK